MTHRASRKLVFFLHDEKLFILALLTTTNVQKINKKKIEKRASIEKEKKINKKINKKFIMRLLMRTLKTNFIKSKLKTF